MEQNQDTLHPGIAYAVLMMDELVHTDEHPICSDVTCPCHEHLQVGTKVLIEVEIRGFFDDSMIVPGGWMPLSRIKAIVEQDGRLPQ